MVQFDLTATRLKQFVPTPAGVGNNACGFFGHKNISISRLTGHADDLCVAESARDRNAFNREPQVTFQVFFGSGEFLLDLRIQQIGEDLMAEAVGADDHPFSIKLTDLFPSHVPVFTDALGDQEKVAGKTEFFEQWQSDGAIVHFPVVERQKDLLWC